MIYKSLEKFFTMDIKLEPHHVRNLVKILDFANFDDVEIPIAPTVEAKPELTGMTSDEIANIVNKQGKPFVIRVDDGIVQSIPQLIKEFGESKTWYNKFSESIRKVLGNSEGSFFLSIMAVMSAQTELEANLTLATRAYHAISQDIKSREKLLRQYIEFMENLPGKGAIKKQMAAYDKSNPDHPYRELRWHKFVVDHGRTDNHLKPTNKVTLYYLDHGKKINTRELTKLISSAIQKSGDLNKDKFIGGFKILNFALNLLDPDYQDEDTGWIPVTIDSWMIYLFYPEVYELENQAKSKRKGEVFSSYYRYTYLAKVVQEQAAKFNMQPHQMQALLWVASIKKYRPNASTKDIHSTIRYMIDQFNEDQAEIQRMLKFVNNLQKTLK